jgi:hypothetical protein
MADVLVPDGRGPRAAGVIDALARAGHRVHQCLEGSDDEGCRQLVDASCPLETAPVDLAVEVGGPPAASLDNGALCAVRRRIPLVLADPPPGHPLEPWAARLTDSAGVVGAVVDVLDHPLPGHTDEARRALLHELRGHGRPSDTATVEVFRLPGRLLVRVSYGPDMSRTEAERLATHVTQAVRGFDRWAPKVDVIVRAAERAPTPAG